ncbi:hypothetical protein QUA56_16405 [Microcoleus sp. N3A4]|uniref:hypothetical protein n=1 Tax=Microcoleus sp. N3A4 TaxID=3055379 RepID=UPI002FD59284
MPTETPESPDITDQIGDVWANFQSLTGVAEIKKIMNAPQQWLMEQPLIQGILSHPGGKAILSWIESSQNVTAFPALIGQCGTAFLETSHGINRAYNSKVYDNLAGAGEKALSVLTSTSTERGIYGDVINAFNNSLNLPELSKTGIKIDYAMGSAWSSINQKKLQMQEEARKLRDKYYQELQDERLKLNDRRRTRAKYNNVARSLVAMGDAPIPSPKILRSTTGTGTGTGTGTETGTGTVIGHSNYDINSIYNDRILSIRSIQVNASALVIVPVVAPIVAVGGALATVGITAGIISSIASWFLTSCMTLIGMPASLISALTHCVTSIVLKVSGSSGAQALRFFAASALKANEALLMTVFGTTNMNVTAWMFLLAMAGPILIVSIIIILAMRNKTALAKTLYIFGDLADNPNRFNLMVASMYDTNAIEILDKFKASAKEMRDTARLSMSQIVGLGLDAKNEYAICYNLTNPDNPVQVTGQEAIVALLGADKVARIATGRLNFMDFI